MNYLGHALLSFGDEAILAGNMIGDHVKGKLALDRYPEGIRKGILLHRSIDSYTDMHPATQRAKLWFREAYGLYASPLMDTLFDHFLANDAKHFNTESDLLEFSQRTYRALEKNRQWFPESFAAYFPYMQQQNWLYNYRTLQGIQRSMNGLHRRAKHMPAVDEAYKIFVTNYYQLAQCYYELMDDVVSFVKTELTI